jgi:hypothetical protein
MVPEDVVGLEAFCLQDWDAEGGHHLADAAEAAGEVVGALSGWLCTPEEVVAKVRPVSNDTARYSGIPAQERSRTEVKP